eukprot:1785839-Amphidinium_carterae.2
MNGVRRVTMQFRNMKSGNRVSSQCPQFCNSVQTHKIPQPADPATTCSTECRTCADCRRAALRLSLIHI